MGLLINQLILVFLMRLLAKRDIMMMMIMMMTITNPCFFFLFDDLDAYVHSIEKILVSHLALVELLRALAI